MGKSERRKGYRGEYKLVKLLKEHGIDAKRIPLSGATEFQKGDVIVENYIGEVKWRKDGFKEIYKWLGDNDFLFIKADRKPYLVVMDIETFIELIGGENGVDKE